MFRLILPTIIAAVLIANATSADEPVVSSEDQWINVPFFRDQEDILLDRSPSCWMDFTLVGDSYEMGNCRVACLLNPNYPDGGSEIVFDSQRDMPGTLISGDACEQELNSQTQYENDNLTPPNNHV